MRKIFQSLGEHKGAIFLIVLLLIVEAWCDLSLPQYTSDIVDVGIQQGGIENAAPDEIRGSTFDSLSVFMTQDEIKTFHEYYSQDSQTSSGDPVYTIRQKGRENIEELNDIFGVPMVMLSYTAQEQDGSENAGSAENTAGITENMPDFSLEQLASLRAAGQLDDETVVKIREEAIQQMGDMSDSIISQMALAFVRQEYDAIGVDTDALQTSYLFRTGGMMLLYSLIMMIAAIAVSYIASRTAAAIGRDLRGRVFKKVVSFSGGETDRFSTASLITRSTNDIQQVQMVCVMLLRMVLYAPVLGIGGIIKVSQTRTGMSWIIAVAVTAIVLLVGTLMAIALPKFKILQTLVDKLNLVSREILTGIPVIRAFSREKHEEERFEKSNRDLMKTQLFTNRVMTFMMPVMMLIMNGISVLIVWQGAKGVDLGNLQVGDMIAFITYTMLIVMSFLMLTMISIMLPRAGVAAARIDEIIQTEVEVTDRSRVRDEELSHITGRIAFEDVSFHYPDAEENSLNHLTFTAEPGQTTAFIGSTGSGKSTIFSLILRFYDVTGGRITLDGIDIRELSQKKLRDSLGYVPQKGVLFSGTIRSNLKFGGDEISDEDMKYAAEIAQASDFIEAKPSKFKSPVSQDGTNVSGGQRQRLSIARAIAKKPKVFLFDDSFSALDYKTDAALRHALDEHIGEATKLIVAQRISTIMHAEQIIVLDEGNVVGIGTHSELMERCETYREIAHSQLSKAELEGGAL